VDLANVLSGNITCDHSLSPLEVVSRENYPYPASPWARG